MKTKEIYDILRSGGLSHAGALGMIGNMMAEAGPSLPSNIAQRGMTKLSDAQYTAAADNGLIDFVHDAVGYGLCQWTYHSRKQGLLNYARQQGVSVGDGVMQVYFCLKELREKYGGVYSVLCNSTSIDDCADVVCTQFERPAVNNLADRRRFAHQFEAQLNDQTQAEPPKASKTPSFDWKVALIQFCMWHDGYYHEPDGQKNSEFFSSLKQYVKDMEGC